MIIDEFQEHLWEEEEEEHDEIPEKAHAGDIVIATEVHGMTRDHFHYICKVDSVYFDWDVGNFFFDVTEIDNPDNIMTGLYEEDISEAIPEEKYLEYLITGILEGYNDYNGSTR